MSRRLRIAKARKQDYEEIEDVDKLINSIPESLETINEEDPELLREKPIYDARKYVPSEDAIEVPVRDKGAHTIYINELDPDIIPPSLDSYMDPEHTGSKIAVIGKPGTGKSRLIKSLLYEKSSIFPVAQVYSGTEDSNHAYAQFIPSTFIFNKFSQPTFIDMIKRQKIAKKYLDNPWAVVVWDDVTEDERIFNLPIVKGSYKNSRHWKWLHILSLQYSLDIKPVIRTNIDGTFILRETIKRNRKVLFENYASVIDDYQDFCTILDSATNEYTSLYIHNRVQSNSFEDCIFWYKAREDIPQDFRLGCDEIWMFNKERFDPKYVEPIDV